MHRDQTLFHKPKHLWRIVVIAVAVCAAGLLIALASVVPFRSETARRKVIETLAARLDAEVELADLGLRVFPQFRADGHGLTIRHKGRRDVPPLISIASFSAEGNVFGLLRRHISRVTVEQLEINIPPDRNRDPDEAPGQTKEKPDAGAESNSVARTFVIDELVSTQARLVIIPRDVGKRP
jgi:uncharacterized protein involved in outer membrane biogenesis